MANTRFPAVVIALVLAASAVAADAPAKAPEQNTLWGMGIAVLLGVCVLAASLKNSKRGHQD